MNILLIEDDPAIAEYICRGFMQAGHNIEWIKDGKVGFALAVEQEFDVCIVDRLLPSLDGLSIVKGLRTIEDSTPVIFLSALSDVDERVNGLTAGADDYLVKPFAFSELEARVNILGHRAVKQTTVQSSFLQFEDLSLNLISRKLHIGSAEIDLQSKEFSLLETFIRYPERIYSRTMLMEKIWGYHFDTQTNVIDVHISNLRRKIEVHCKNCQIKTIRGSGYVLEKIKK